MLHDIEAQLIDIEKDLAEVERTAPKIIRTAAQDRYALEIKRAEVRDDIKHRDTVDAAEAENDDDKVAKKKKPSKPTIPEIDAEVVLATQEELEKSRQSTAELDVMKTKLESLQSRLTSVQTRAKMSSMEMSLAR